MSAQNLSIGDMIALMRRNLVPVVVVIMICLGLAVGSLALMSPRFKSKSVLNIDSAYFQTAMVGDILHQVSDSAEQNVQRAVLLRLALNDDFIDSLGDEFKIFKFPPEDIHRPTERANLLKNIEYFPQSSTSYEINVISPDARTAYEMNKKVLSRIITKLTEDRQSTLIRTRDSIAARVKSLNVALKDTSGVAASLRPDNVRADLEKIRADIEAMSAQYSPNHPEVLKLKQREEYLKTLLGNTDSSRSKNDSGTSISATAKAPTQEFYNELVKKLNYLNVVVDLELGDQGAAPYLNILEQPSMPLYPIFPPKVKIMVLGFVVGMLLSAAVVAFLELRRGTFLVPSGAAGALGVPLLGELPRLRTPENARVPLLPGPGQYAIRERLPEVIKEE